MRGLGTTVIASLIIKTQPLHLPLVVSWQVRGVKAQRHLMGPFDTQPLIHHDKCAQMIWPSSTNGERRDRLQLIHPALLWANWSASLLLHWPSSYLTPFIGGHHFERSIFVCLAEACKMFLFYFSTEELFSNLTDCLNSVLRCKIRFFFTLDKSRD